MKKGLGLMLLGLVVLLVSGCAEGEQRLYEGVIQDKYFQKGGLSTGVGLNFSGETLTPVVTTTSESDTYIIFVNNKDYTVSKNVWLQLDKGMTIRYTDGFSGINVRQIVVPKDTDDAEEPKVEGEQEPAGNENEAGEQEKEEGKGA